MVINRRLNYLIFSCFRRTANAIFSLTAILIEFMAKRKFLTELCEEKNLMEIIKKKTRKNLNALGIFKSLTNIVNLIKIM